MKKLISPLFIALALVVIPTAFSRAETVALFGKQSTTSKIVVPAEKPAVTSSATTTVTTDTEDDLKDLPLAERRDKVATELRDLTAKFSTYAARTQLALDRLHDKHIATGKAQDELTLSVNGLAKTKLALDAFAAITIPETDQDKAALEIKNSVKNIQDQLKDARAHLITALTLVKTAVSASIDADISVQ